MFFENGLNSTCIFLFFLNYLRLILCYFQPQLNIIYLYILMQIFNLKEKSDLNPSSIVTIGNFDGVHLGHRALIDNVVGDANSKNFRSA